MAGVTGVTGLPEGDGRTLVCRWPTGIPASHLPPALLSDPRTPNERIRLCVASAWRNCLAHSARCERRTARSAHTAHCTRLLTVYLRGRLAGAGTSPSPLTLSPLTTDHSLLPQPCRVIQVLFHHAAAAAAVLLSRTPTSFSEHSLYSLLHPHPRTQPLGSSQRTSYPARSS